LLWSSARIINEDVTTLQFPHEVIGCVVFEHSKVADDLSTPTAGKDLGRHHINAYKPRILGHYAEQVVELDLQFSEGAFAHSSQEAP
jgi:hypothetical protein